MVAEVKSRMAWKTTIEAQVEEIKKHKWIESEKAGRDLGKEAELDWVINHAADFREYCMNDCEFQSDDITP